MFQDGQCGGLRVGSRDGHAGAHPRLPRQQGRGELQHPGHARPPLPQESYGG